MKKFAIAAAATAPFMAAPAFAGPYVMSEVGAGYTGSNYNDTLVEFRVGYEDYLGENTTYFVELGPAWKRLEGGDGETGISGKIGINHAATEKLDIYGEATVAVFDADNNDPDYRLKVGAKYKF